MGREGGTVVSCPVCRRNLAEAWVRAIVNDTQQLPCFEIAGTGALQDGGAPNAASSNGAVAPAAVAAENTEATGGEAEQREPPEANEPPATESGDAMDTS